MEVKSFLGPMTWSTCFEKSQILGFSHDTNMSVNGVSHYRVRLEDVFGNKKTLSSGIPSAVTAEALAQRLNAWKI